MSKKIKRKFGPNTILSKLLLPVIAVMLAQSLLYLALFWQGGVVSHANENAYDILDERVANRKQYIENEMLHKWINFRDSEEKILNTISDSLERRHANYRDIATDAKLNEELVAAVSDDIVYMLRRCMVTGAFIVLDGPGVQGNEHSRAGLYIRDLDPVGYVSDDSDLLMERGMPSIVKSRGIALDSFWAPVFTFNDPENRAEAFFYAPIKAARENENKDSVNYGFWSGGFSLSGQDDKIITYSIPLINADGVVFGVMGIDITEQYMYSLLQYQEISTARNGAYVLAITEDHGQTYQRIIANGPLYQYAFGEAGSIAVQGEITDSIYNFESNNVPDAWGSVQKLKLYNPYTPFYDQQWVLIGLVRGANLLSFSQTITMLSTIATVAFIVLGVVSVFFASRMVTQPITSLVNEVTGSDPNQLPKLKKLNIKEIDELTSSIEALSQSVVESSSKISKILHLTKASIGVFEYTKGNPTVFCSSNLFDILNLPNPPHRGEDYCLMDTDAFNAYLDEVFEKSCEGLEGIYALQQTSGEPRYVQITMLNEGERVLGAVSDVTEDVLVKFRIEFERDYDVLTNLFNRRAFQIKALERLESQDVGVAALVMLDLDNLKYINDTYGHDYGDRYIVSLSECLQFFSSHNAITARRSGDEFYTLLYGYSSREEARAVIEEGWQLIREKSFYLPNGSDYRIRVSGGIAWYPEDATDLDMLIRYADFAMYNSKHTVKGSLLEFNREIYANSISVLYGQEALNQRLDNVGLKFALQPIITVSTGEVYGYELLMRPQSDGLKNPGDVLQIAQAQSKLHHIEHLSWMRGMETFCTLVEQEKIAPEKKVFINSIGSQCMSEVEVAQFAERFGPYLDRIVLELMESDPGNTAYTNYKVQTVRNWGGMVAVDDYGTGYNSGASLIFLSPDIVKLDMSIVRDIDKNVNRQALLKDLLSYLKTQEVQVLAEGVETQGEMELLVSFGVEYIQGYYTGRPSFEPQPISHQVASAIRSAYEKRLLQLGQEPTRD